jgi:uncharacterized Tic20 family protein
MPDTKDSPDNAPAMLSHLIVLLAYAPLGALFQILAPFAGAFSVRQLKKTSPFVEAHSRRSINWQVTYFSIILVLGGGTIGTKVIQQHLLKSEWMKQIELEKSAAPGATRDAAEAAIGKAGEAYEDSVKNFAGNPAVVGGLLALAALSFVNIGFVVRNAVRAYRGLEAKYPPSIPVLRAAAADQKL